MAFTLVTVTGTYHRAPGSTPASGQVVFQLQQTLSQPGEILEPQALSATLDSNGHISLPLVATDDPTTQPQGATWLVTEVIQGEVPRNYNIAVPHTAGSIDLATVAPVVPGPQNFSYVLTSSVGQPNGVASLDSGGHLPSAQLPTVPVPDIPPLPISQITGLAAELATDEANIASNTSAIAANTTALAGKAAATQLGASNGTDDTATINSALTTGRYVRGLPGQTYLITGPLVVPSSTTLEMTGCTVTYANTSVRTNLLNNATVAPSNTATDVTTTAGSAVITSPTLAAAGAAIGHSVGVVAAGASTGGGGTQPRVWFYGAVTAVSGNNITLGGNFLATNADVSLTNATGYLFKTRDTNVTVIGGTWDAGTNWNVSADRYNAAYNSNLLRFRRCDGLTIRDVKLSIDYGYASSGLGWCFGINPADCSKILIENVRNVAGQAAPTFINSSGLIQHCVVRNVEGTSYDDMVAFGCVGAGGDDIEGDIGNLVIDGVFSPAVGGPAAWNKGSNRGVDLYCGKGSNGQQRVLWSFDVRSVKGTYNNWPVSIVSYPAVTGQAANFTGRLGDISGTASGKPSIFIGRADGTNGGLNTGLDCAGTVTGPNTGGDLDYRQITANASYGPTLADVTGLFSTFVAPPSGVVWLEAYGYTVQQGTGAGNLLLYITDNSNNIVEQWYGGNIAAAGVTPSPHLKVRISGLVCGTSYTYKLRGSSVGAGAPSILASTSFPAWMRAAAV